MGEGIRGEGIGLEGRHIAHFVTIRHPWKFQSIFKVHLVDRSHLVVLSQLYIIAWA